MKKAFYIIASICLIIIAGSALYFFVAYPHVKEAMRVSNLNACKKDYENIYTRIWDRECNRQGLKASCEDLPTDVVKVINNMTKRDLDVCLAKYSR